ncbi:MAG: zinc-binding dehydrogenase [Planctomycetia bacterium]
MAPTTLRRVVLHGVEDVRLEQAPAPVPGPGEVLLAPEVALTGGTVLKAVRRGGHVRLGAPPMVLGHEGVGRIVALGHGVAGWRVGERVLPGPSAPCGACSACRRGRTTLCSAACWWSGLYAGLALLPAALVARNLHRVPEGLASEVAALADNVASVLHGLERTPPRAGERALVLGSGPLGLLWTAFLARAGCEVTLCSRRGTQVPLGVGMGATRVLALAQLGAHERFELVVEAAGAPEAWQEALARTAPGARVNLFGGVPAGSQLHVDATRLHYEELLVTAAFHYAPAQLDEALAWLAPGGAGASLAPRLLGEEVALEALPGWLQAACRAPAPAKAIVRPQQA